MVEGRAVETVGREEVTVGRLVTVGREVVGRDVVGRELLVLGLLIDREELLLGLLTDRDEVEGREDPREREPLEEDRAVDWEPRELPDEPLLCADARSVASRKARTRTGRKTIRRVRMGISG